MKCYVCAGPANILGKKPCKKSADLHHRQGNLVHRNIFTGLKKTSLCYTKYVGRRSGTDDMILKIFSPKNLAKIFAFFAQTTVIFCKNCDHNIGF
jgi:hypothetical protein